MKVYKLSVVTPTVFGDYLEDTLDRLWNGTDLSFEHIIIADKFSKDVLFKLKDKYENAYQYNRKMRIFLNPNLLGATGAYNLGLLLAQGDFIALLADDVAIPEKWLDKLVGTLIRNPEFGWVSCEHDHEWKIRFHTNVSLISREVIDKVGILDYRYNPLGREFEDLLVRVVNAGYKPHSVANLFFERREKFSSTLRRLHPDFNRIHDSQALFFLKRTGFLIYYDRFIPYYNGETSIPEGCKIECP